MRILSALTFGALLTWAQAVLAATVVVVRPPTPSAQTAETLTLLHGELASVGIEDTLVERPVEANTTGTDFRSWLEQLAAERAAIAVIDLLGDDGSNGVDVWVRKSPGRLEVTRVTVDRDTSDSSATVAIRALEALRASLVELDLAARYLRDQPAAKPSVARAPTPPEPQQLVRTRAKVGLEIGPAVLVSPGGVGPSVLPSLRFDWAVRPMLLVEVALAGFGTQPSVTTQAGSARVTREYGLLGGCYRPWSDRNWWPFLAIAGGALHTSITGRVGGEMDAHRVGKWSLLADAGLGATMRFYRSYHLTLSGHVQVAHPYVAIHFGDPVTATAGRPNLLLTLGVGAWL